MQWVEVSTLGGSGGDYDGEVMFVGQQCSRAVATRNSVRRDQIYFLTDDEWTDSMSRRWPSCCDHRAAVYDMRDGRVTDVQQFMTRRDALAPATWLFPVAEH